MILWIETDEWAARWGDLTDGECNSVMALIEGYLGAPDTIA